MTHGACDRGAGDGVIRAAAAGSGAACAGKAGVGVNPVRRGAGTAGARTFLDGAGWIATLPVSPLALVMPLVRPLRIGLSLARLAGSRSCDVAAASVELPSMIKRKSGEKRRCIAGVLEGARYGDCENWGLLNGLVDDEMSTELGIGR